MRYLEFYDLLSSFNLIEPIDKYLLSLLEAELEGKNNKDDLLMFFSIVFSLVDDGNACVSLDKKTLLEKWKKKLDGKEVLLKEVEGFKDEDFQIVRYISNKVIEDVISEINDSNLPKLIGKNKYFYIDNDYIFIKKYYDARNGVISSVKRLFRKPTTNNKYHDYLSKDSLPLTNGQIEAISKGINSNLVITGGPGTGKTTSVVFLLLNLLENNPNQMIYLVAPSGKASGRIKESVLAGLKFVDKSKVQPDVIKKIEGIEESTIHRLLHIDPNTSAFTRNHNYQFAKNSIFIVDEASMIDICLFASLLDAIPDEARLFILGDYNQLPSVEAGAVFANLVDMEYLKNDFVVRLTEFVRFSKDSEIFKVASEINGDISLSEKNWQSYQDFQIIDLAKDSKDKPVYFYKNPDGNVKEKEIISSIVTKWGEKFYKGLQEKCTDIDDDNKLVDVYNSVSEATILCAVNEGIRGTKQINNLIRNKFIDKSKKTNIFGYYQGQLIIINKNNKELGLYNGNTGILVSFKDDDTLYFMYEKTSKDASISGKKVDEIFSLTVQNHTYMFYPLRMISETDFDLAYAITIHKSQGSDFNNILVILPTSKGHPLLTKQIVYTAITRSKGSAYILSNQDRLLEAQRNFEVRDTNIK